ncbi:hypothetical protein DVH24_015857 [Malus domestica]|uniref:Uncharacterized protein n=1 Tax=Malus domestica TaxID=3750 RepID=A0A498JE55_MALDO|nr:hypothetical protein DVH24_015857 [Malus domestica]
MLFFIQELELYLVSRASKHQLLMVPRFGEPDLHIQGLLRSLQDLLSLSSRTLRDGLRSKMKDLSNYKRDAIAKKFSSKE